MRPLVLAPALTAHRLSDGRVGVTGKFLSGVQRFQEAWPGGWIRVLMEESESSTDALDNEGVDPRSLPYELELVSYEDEGFADRIADAAVVLGSLGYRQNDLPDRCSAAGVPFVTTSEYTLQTRRQIVVANTPSKLLQARRFYWEMGQERKNVHSVRVSAGIQCNGTPTFEAYRALSRAPMLYFDTRVYARDLIDAPALERRLARLRDSAPLRLAFSGRLAPMKGAHLLPEIARLLRARGRPFHLSICGDGISAPEIRAAIGRLGLEDCVEMKGVLDFHRELLPFVKENVDLFVCPHIQGDPSCTYMETFSCGVPIAGFANEAFRGLCDLAPIGWQAEVGDCDGLAARIAAIDSERGLLAVRSREARRLANDHAFEATFQRRIDHLLSLARTDTSRA